MFEKNLQDLIKGIRSHKRDGEAYVSKCIAEIRKELKGSDASLKANGILKLVYLQLLGHDISWACTIWLKV